MLAIHDIYHPKIASFYFASQWLSLILTSLVIFPAIYIVLTKSRRATSFKYLLIYQLISCYAFCIHLFLDSYVPLFPLPAFYSVSPFVLPEYIGVIVHLFLSIAATNSYFLTVFYRMTYASAFSRFQPIFEDPRKLMVIIFGFLLIISGIIVAPFLFIPYDSSQLKQEMLIQYPVLQELIKLEPTVTVSPTSIFPHDSILSTCLYIYSVYIPCAYIASIFLYLSIVLYASKSKDSMNPQTYKKYLIVVRAQTVQIISTTILIMIPYGLLFFALQLKSRSGNLISVISFFFPSYYVFLEVLALFYFVKPYRDYLSKRIFRQEMLQMSTRDVSERVQELEHKNIKITKT